jgi:hypothetical protein
MPDDCERYFARRRSTPVSSDGDWRSWKTQSGSASTTDSSASTSLPQDVVGRELRDQSSEVGGAEWRELGAGAQSWAEAFANVLDLTIDGPDTSGIGNAIPLVFRNHGV